jgi:hypothetical protein
MLGQGCVCTSGARARVGLDGLCGPSHRSHWLGHGSTKGWPRRSSFGGDGAAASRFPWIRPSGLIFSSFGLLLRWCGGPCAPPSTSAASYGGGLGLQLFHACLHFSRGDGLWPGLKPCSVLSGADHGDAYGRLFLLGGVVMGVMLLLMCAEGNPRSGFARSGSGGATMSVPS